MDKSEKVPKSENQSSRYERIKYTEVNEIVFYVCEFIYKLSHIHHDMEIDLVLDGRFFVRTNDEFYEAHEGNILVFNPYKPHEFISQGQHCRVLTIQLRKKFCENYFPLFKYTYFKNSCVNTPENDPMFIQLRQTVFNLGYNYYLEQFGFELCCYSDLNAIIFMLLKLMPYDMHNEQEAAVSEKYDGRFNRISRYIEEHYSQKITLKGIAEAEGLSPSYLSHFLKRRMNMSFQDYVNILRFEHAIQLLVQTDKKLVDICMESGFSESKYFNKIFAKNYQMKPKEFRQMARNSWGKAVPEFERGERKYYNKDECLGILRRYFHFSCDDTIRPSDAAPSCIPK